MEKRKITPLKNHVPCGGHCPIHVKRTKLGMVSFFQSLTNEELDDVVKRFTVHHYLEGEEIYYQGEPASYLRVVVAGAVKLLLFSDDGKDVILDLLNPGSYFGSLMLLGNDTYPETAIAQSGCCILSIGLQDFRQILHEYPSLAISTLEMSSEKMRSLQEKVKRLTTQPVETRIANILYALCEKFGEENSEGMLLQLPFSRRDLADMAGTTTESASRVMSSLQRQGIIKTGRQWVSILDMESLKNLR